MLLSINRAIAEDKTETSTIILLHKKGNDKIRPHDDNQDNSVECYLENGKISILFENPEGMATVTLSEYGTDIINRTVASTLTNIEVPYIYSDVPTLILIRTSQGNKYEGWIDLQTK